MEKVPIDKKKVSVGNYALLLTLKGDIFFAPISGVEKSYPHKDEVYFITIGNFQYQTLVNKNDRSSEKVYKNTIIDIFTKKEMDEAKSKINFYYKKIKEIKEMEQKAKYLYDSIIQRRELESEDIQNIKNDEKTTRLLESMKGI